MDKNTPKFLKLLLNNIVGCDILPKEKIHTLSNFINGALRGSL